jgi:glycerate dehydrogenase
MRIVVLDGYTLNPGDLDWTPLEALGECQIHDRTAPELTVERASGAEVVLTNKTILDAPVLGRLDALRYIGVLATGYNVVDLDAASRRGIVATNVPAYSTESVAQMVFAHVLNLTQQVGHHARTVREGKWTRSEDFCYWDAPLVELQGLTMGIVGLGRIGKAVARAARAFGMRVAAYDAFPTTGVDPDVEMVDTVDELVAQADVVSLHCPLTDQNKHLVNAEWLARMKPTALLINTSRGPLVDEQALADALSRGAIGGAGLDVLSVEPPAADNPLLSAPNCFITPHVAWATRAARQRLLTTAVENVAAFLEGKPRNQVG